MNKININDLEAIYFVDKVNMRSNSASENNIPKLDFNVFQQQVNKYVIQERENSSNLQQMKNYEEYKKLQLKHQTKLNNAEKLSISPMKSFLKDGDRIQNMSQSKKLKMNNIHDTTLDKGK